MGQLTSAENPNVNNLVVIELPPPLLSAIQEHQQGDTNRVSVWRCIVIKESFFTTIIRTWNQLSDNIVMVTSLISIKIRIIHGYTTP